jgi:hypothetical protein
VQPPGGQFLARAALADHEHRPVYPGGGGQALHELQEGVGLAQGLGQGGKILSWHFLPFLSFKNYFKANNTIEPEQGQCNGIK